jgi:hypothetical protein
MASVKRFVTIDETLEQEARVLVGEVFTSSFLKRCRGTCRL